MQQIDRFVADYREETRPLASRHGLRPGTRL